MRPELRGSLTLGKTCPHAWSPDSYKEERADRPHSWDGVQDLTITIVSGRPPGLQSPSAGGGRVPNAA